ncbi:hypothetical protein I552_0668 [Mycobacterium xenopi 3993]|nr:hypothetical protein I552_0668 [Mycobacterium xenopi 3993]
MSMFPDKPLHSAPALSDPVTCWQWVKRAGEQQAKAALAFLPGLPLREQQQRMWRHELVSRPGVSMYAPPIPGISCRPPDPIPAHPPKKPCGGSPTPGCATGWRRRSSRAAPRPPRRWDCPHRCRCHGRCWPSWPPGPR